MICPQCDKQFDAENATERDGIYYCPVDGACLIPNKEPKKDLVGLWEESKKIPDLEGLIRQTIANIIGEDRPSMDVPDVVEEIVRNLLPIIKQYKTSNTTPRKVVVLVNGGVVEIPKAPPGTTVIVRDYDIDGVDESFLKKDSSGSFYAESTYEF